MLAARVAVGMLILCAAAVASVSLGLDQWTLNTADKKFFMSGLRSSCSATGCSPNNYSVTTFGNCSVSASTLEGYNNASWGIQLGGLSLFGLGALFIVLSSKFRLPAFIASLSVTVAGEIAYVVGGGLAYNVTSEWMWCGVTFCDQYYASGGIYCLSQQGPSFALWCIAIATFTTASVGGVWLIASDITKSKAMKMVTRKEKSNSSLRAKKSRANASATKASPRRSSPMRAIANTREPVVSSPRAVESDPAIPAGYVLQPDSHLYYSATEQMFFDVNSGHYYSPKHKAWYNPDTKQWYALDAPAPAAQA